MHDASFGVGGVSSINADLKQLSDQDFSNTVIYMMIGIFLILVLLFRSIVMPVYLVGSLVLTYFASIGVTEFISRRFRLSRPQLGGAFLWLCDLMALGVDYSIFLMERFNEYRGTDIKTAMTESMKIWDRLLFQPLSSWREPSRRCCRPAFIASANRHPCADGSFAVCIRHAAAVRPCNGSDLRLSQLVSV
ncbi:MMPL family transporter [Bacillus licheniformis]|nr:MMPL family transporter [Bacillus licheniformis]